MVTLRLDTALLPGLIRGHGELGFRRPDRHDYKATDAVQAGMRLLVVDDVYMTGARANSAASRDAGAYVARLLVLARRVDPDSYAQASVLWSHQRAAPFDWTTSPLLAGEVENGPYAARARQDAPSGTPGGPRRASGPQAAVVGHVPRGGRSALARAG